MAQKLWPCGDESWRRCSSWRRNCRKLRTRRTDLKSIWRLASIRPATASWHISDKSSVDRVALLAPRKVKKFRALDRMQERALAPDRSTLTTRKRRRTLTHCRCRVQVPSGHWISIRARVRVTLAPHRRPLPRANINIGNACRTRVRAKARTKASTVGDTEAVTWHRWMHCVQDQDQEPRLALDRTAAWQGQVLVLDQDRAQVQLQLQVPLQEKEKTTPMSDSKF